MQARAFFGVLATIPNDWQYAYAGRMALLRSGAEVLAIDHEGIRDSAGRVVGELRHSPPRLIDTGRCLGSQIFGGQGLDEEIRSIVPDAPAEIDWKLGNH